MRLINIASETYANCSRSILLINCNSNNIFAQHNIEEYANYLFKNKIYGFRFKAKSSTLNDSLLKALILRNNPQIDKYDDFNVVNHNLVAILICITHNTEQGDIETPISKVIVQEIPAEADSYKQKELIKSFLDCVIAIEKEYLKSGIEVLHNIRFRIKEEPPAKTEIAESEEFIATDILSDTISPNTEIALSKLCIDDCFEIHLPLYPQIKIELAPLPKSLYILLLLHPEGFTLKKIHDYSNELIRIYCIISGRQNPTVIKKMFDSITDPTTNPLHKNLSIIRRAFLSKLRTDIAEQYIPTQGRYQPHRIPLDCKKIELPKTITVL